MVAVSRNLIRTLWHHTNKAIKNGEPSNRVLAVVDVVKDQGKWYLLAWKCTKLPDYYLDHPGFKEPLHQDDNRVFALTGETKATPTAMFRPVDSSYCEMTRAIRPLRPWHKIEYLPEGLMWVDEQIMQKPPGWYIFLRPDHHRIPNYIGPLPSEAACYRELDRYYQLEPA